MRSRTARHRTTTTAVAFLAAAGLALLATGCQDDLAEDGGSGKNPSANPSASAGKPSDDGSQGPSDGASEDPSDGGSTGPGSGKVDGDLDKTLALGTSTKVSYQRGSGAATVLEVAATSVKKGSVNDLDQVPLDAEQRGLQPYYVTMSFKNAGKTNLGYPSLNSAANLRDSRGEEGKRVATLDDDVAACPNKTPDTFPAGAEATLCSVVLLPKSETPSVVRYTADYEKGTVYWKAS